MGSRAYDLGAGLTLRLLTTANVLVDKVTRGRARQRLAGIPVVWLTTTGRRSRRPRRVPLIAARDGDAFLVAGSAGGRERAPSWVVNLRGHVERREPARLVVDGEELSVDVEELLGEDHERGFAQMVRLYRGYAGYQRRTSRVIPVFRLTPR